MRHNSHVFEPEVLEHALVHPLPAVTCSRWYSSHRPRTGLVIQGLRRSGKTTMCNAILGGGLLPYFHSLPSFMVPSIVVDWSAGTLVDPSLAKCGEESMIDLELFSRPSPSAPPGGMSSRENSNRSFSSRSVSDSMVREVLETPSLCSREGSLSRQDLIDVLAPLAHIRSPIRDEILQHRSIGPFIEQLSKAEGLVAEMERAVFLRVTLNPNAAAQSSTDEVDGPSPLFRVVESQSVEDRPALHLVHTMVFVMAQDEAFAHLRPPGHGWDDRHSALVASMSAINTCDGKKCKPCLVVNLGHDVIPMENDQATTKHVETMTKQASDDEFVLVDYPLADDMVRMPIEQSASVTNKSAESSVANSFFSNEDSLHATRATLARKWRLPEKNVFFFSAQLILAHRVVSRISPPGAGGVGSVNNPLGLHPLQLREFESFCEFIESNRSLGIVEWEGGRRNQRKEVSDSPRGTIPKAPLDSAVLPQVKSAPEEHRDESAAIIYPFAAAPANDPRVVTFASGQEAKDEAQRRHLAAREKQRKEELVKIMKEVQSDQLDVARRVASQ